MVAAHHNPSLKSFADRLRKAGKPHKVIITAVARKLVTIANALCKKHQNWTPCGGLKDTLANSTYSKFRVTQHSVSRISSEALTTLYEGSSANRNALVNISKPAQGAIGRSVGFWLPRVSVAAGAVVASAGVARGIERQDTNEVVGNIAMLIGGLLLFPGLGWVAALVGGVLLFIGFLFSLGTYSKMEDVVRLSFWGWAVPYWGDNDRASFTAQKS